MSDYVATIVEIHDLQRAAERLAAVGRCHVDIHEPSDGLLSWAKQQTGATVNSFKSRKIKGRRTNPFETVDFTVNGVRFTLYDLPGRRREEKAA